MSKSHKSESLFGSNELNSAKPTIKRRSPEEIANNKKQVQDSAKKDYIFVDNLKKVFQSEAELQDSAKQNVGIVKELEKINSSFAEKEISIVSKANQKRKRHYLLNGDVCVYCYIKNLWPKLIIRPLTVRLENEKIPKIDRCDKDNEMILKVKFKPITIGIRKRIDPFIFDIMPDSNSSMSINIDEYKKLAFICCFKEWNIPINVEIEDERVTEECWEILKDTIHPKLFDTIMSEFIYLNDMSEEENEILLQQSERLFAKESSGVNNPSEGVRLYCEASTFYKEFGLFGKSLDNLPYRVASMMKLVANRGNEIHIRQMEATSKKSSKSAKTVSGRK